MVSVQDFFFLFEMEQTLLNDEIEEEEIQYEREFQSVHLEDSELLPLGEYFPSTLSLVEKIKYFKNLSRDQRKSLFLTASLLRQIESCLIKSKYVISVMRKYFCGFITFILGVDHPDYPALIKMFEKSPSELSYIRTRYRNRLWSHFLEWRDCLIFMSYRKKSKWVYANGQCTQECRDILKKFKYLYSFEKAIDSDLVEVVGAASEETFREDLKLYSELATVVTYTQIIASDDCDSRSGDKVESNLVDIPLLPFNLYPVHDSGVGRGAIGAHLLLTRLLCSDG
jgi:hypothetical protein